METGSLYPALHRLERQGWVRSEWKLTESNQRAKYYRVTATGKKQLASDHGRWQQMVAGDCCDYERRTGKGQAMSWWRFFARRRSDLAEEIEAHLRMAVRDRVERGETPVEARAAAAKEFGNVPLMKDVTRETWGWEWLESGMQDLKYALRRLMKSPGFTIAAIATLALGIGANTAIFELLDTVLLQSLPVANPQELAEVRLVDMDKARGSVSSGYPVVTNPIWEKLREDHQGFSGDCRMEGYRFQPRLGR